MPTSSSSSSSRLRALVRRLGATACLGFFAAGGAGAAPEPQQDFVTAARRHIAEREYWASPSDRGLQAPNRRQGLRTYFGPRGIRVVDRTAVGAPELLSLRLEAFGRESATSPVAEAEVHAERARVELRRPGLVEWYRNGEAGLEQGFTVSRRPDGDGRLVFSLRLDGARAARRGHGLALRTATGRTLHYDKLAAFDANGSSLPVEMAAPAAGRIELRVDDADAAYPVVVDPLLSESEDTRLEGDQQGALMGLSVASAGDVNGDGYADVIVGANGYDAGEPLEGAAFVFLGGPGGIADAGPASAQAQLEADQDSARLGISVASAGDVNADGYADVIVGAFRYDAGLTDAGAAFVFLGGPSGVLDGDPATAHARLEGDQFQALFGRSVASAGDVNGDGYADVIVGASLYHAGQVDEGAAFVFHGSASGIADGGPATADGQLEGDQANAQLGTGVASAGDVDGDGYADVIAAARGFESGHDSEGAAFVFLGSASGVASAGTGAAHAQLEGNQESARFGSSVSSAGDVNGDGFSDVIVGAENYDAGQDDEGAAFVFLGSPTGISGGGPSTAHTQLEGGQASAYLGSSVSAAGDVNGDGYADVVVGAYGYDAAATNEGAAFVFLGSASGIADGSPTTAFAMLAADQQDAWMGASVGGAGDVNGDGYDDVIVGAYLFDAPLSTEGAAFIYHGGSEGLLDAGALAADARLESNQVDGGLGISVASAGDVNGDGYADVIVGAKGYDAGEADEGAAFVFLGGAAGIDDAIPASAHAQLESDQSGGGMGSAVAPAGDVNGDGYDDVIVGTDGYDGPEADEGVAFVFHGGPAGVADGDPTTAAARFETDQAFAADGRGTMVASAGDLNGDGYADVLLGAPFWDVGGVNNVGTALFFLGSATGIDDGTAATAWEQIEGGAFNDRLGSSVASAGDVDGDGYADVIVGMNLDDTAFGTNTGAALVLLGGAASLGYDGLLSGTEPGSSFGFSVASAGDVNGDGHADVIVGAPSHDEGLGNEGAAFVFLGSATGVGDASAVTAHATLSGDQLGAGFGFSVASAGDVNGDGYADVIVGARGFDAGETDEGAAFVFLGSAAGLADGSPATAATWLESDQADAELGTSVAGAGDVDGDGFADVIVGAPGYDASQSDEGAAFVFGPGVVGAGRPALARQLASGTGDPIAAWGLADGGGFDVSLQATHPMGRGLVKAEVEWCPAGADFGDAGCGGQVASTWTDVTATPGGVDLIETVTGLVPDTLYRWRARVLHAPLHADAPGVTSPPNPAHGPWRRPTAQAREADVRAVPEPGGPVSLVAGFLLLAQLGRRRSRSAFGSAARRRSPGRVRSPSRRWRRPPRPTGPRRVEASSEELAGLRRGSEKVFQAPPVEWIEERLAGMHEVLERRTERSALLLRALLREDPAGADEGRDRTSLLHGPDVARHAVAARAGPGPG